MESTTSSSSVTPKLNFAMFGAGRIGVCHLHSMVRHPRIRLKWLVEEDTDRAHTVLAELGEENVSVIAMKDVRKVWTDESVKGVVICTPTPTHQEVITQAINAGKPVFCEKPIAHTLAAAEECYDLAEACGLTLFCGFNHRFDPHFAAVIRRVHAGTIGQLRYIQCTMRDTLDPNFPGLSHLGSIFLDLALHNVDTICTLAEGQLPITVTAQGHAFSPKVAANDTYDQAVVTLKFPSGLIANIELSRFCCYGYDQRLEVFGMDGMLEASNVQTNQVKCSTVEGAMQDKILPSFPQRFEESYYNELDHFVRVIEGKEVLSVTRKQALSALRIVEACELSAKSGTIVTMDN